MEQSTSLNQNISQNNLNDKDTQEENLINHQNDKKQYVKKNAVKIYKQNIKKKKHKELSILDLVSPYVYLNIDKVYHLNGDFIVCLSKTGVFDNFIIKLAQVEEHKRYFQCQMSPIKFLKDFHIPIQILENSQDIDKYNFAQQLKAYQFYSQDCVNQIQEICQTYVQDQYEFIQLNQKRSQFRKELMNNYTNTYLKDEEFFTVVEVGPNFDLQQIETLKLLLSKGLFALIGVEEKDINQYLLHVGMGDNIFFSQTEKLFGTVLQIIQSNKFNQNYYQKDFIINTLDELKICCDTEYQINQVIYPQELQYKCEGKQLKDQEFIVLIKFEISCNQIESILNFRQNNKNIQYNDQISIQSIEYQMLSEIFIEKYYPKKYKDLLKLNHRGQQKNILLFDKNFIQPLMCLSCAQIASKNSNKVIDINQFIYSEDDSVFSNFPPLQDETLYEQLDELLATQDNNYLDKLISQIKTYFTSLKQQICEIIDTQEKKIKDNIIQKFNNDSLIDTFNNISQKEKLKNLYTNYNEESAQRIIELINQMYQNIEQNTQLIKQKVDVIMEFQKKFSSDQPLTIKNQLIQLIKQIEFFQDSPLNQNKPDLHEQQILSNVKPQEKVNQIELLSFEKSKNFKNSQQIVIEKLKTNELLIRQSIDGYGLFYSNFILDPKKKYIFRFEIQSIANKSEFSFIVGLIKENQKNDCELEGGIRLNYLNKSNQRSSLSLSATGEQSSKHFEIRIHLQDKLFEIASLPRYHPVYEIQNKQTIQENCQFRLAFLIYHASYQFLVNYFGEVEQFEKNI
ncbi:hypothetical protein ABPG74_001434 [Tetrahymena malaccensis]